MDLLYAGFDKLEVAFQGALSEDAIEVLAKARDEAAERQCSVLVSLGPGKVDMHVAGHGMRGGYAFIGDTGSLGETWVFKKSTDPRQWNIAAFAHASGLAVHGYHRTRDRLWQRLKDMGCRVMGESIRRVDYAMDFLAPGFDLRLDRFVAHGHCKVQPHWSERDRSIPTDKPLAVLRGRHLETVTIGKMPGRQVTVYDKRKAAIEQRKLFWFKVWDIDRHDPSQGVWRVEIRAGKTELKERWGIRTFEDVENSIGDVFRHAATQVRYLDDIQTDTNVSRQRLHPLWRSVMRHLDGPLMAFRSGLLPGQFREIERALAVETYTRLIVGNAAGLAVALGLTNAEIASALPRRVADRLAAAISDPEGRFDKSVARARERLHFIA